MEELLEPWVHYIPVEEDFSDLEDILAWARANDEKCKMISRRATLWVYDLLLNLLPEKTDGFLWQHSNSNLL